MAQQSTVPAPPQYVQMEKPEVNFDCPPGLEYLTQIDQLLVHQQVNLIEVLTDWECNNKYEIKNSLGQTVYFMAENTDACMRQCCGSDRAFTMHVVDNQGKEVIKLNRSFKCCAGCGWCAGCSDCCAHEVTVEAPPGQIVATCRQKRSPFIPQWTINDAEGNIMFHVEGPKWCIWQGFCCGLCCTDDVKFKVLSLDREHEVGVVAKQWAGVEQEMFTNAHNFGITFPMDLDVKMKAGMLAALLSVQFQIFAEDHDDTD